MADRVPVRRALVSVWDKTGVVDLARGLADAGAEIVSSGGTATALRDAGLNVRDVSEVTGFPEMLDGRVKTLHPHVHAGILADRSKPEHLSTIAERGIEPVDLVVVNLYPFDAKVDAATPEAEAVELIDVGGPTMVRAAAKNYAGVGVVVDPADYDAVLEEVRGGGLTAATRRALSAKAFRRLSAYDATVAAYLGSGEPFPEALRIAAARIDTLRYGENPHQQAAAYRLPGPRRGLAAAEQLQGKELSYCNYLDLDAAYKLAIAFERPAAIVVKHTNPCGAALADDIADAYRMAYEGDPRSAFGGIVGLNRPCTKAAADRMAEIFLECVVAPEFEPEALEILSAKKNLRLMCIPREAWAADPVEVRSVSGGLLVQTPDRPTETRADMRVVTKRAPTEDEWRDLEFALVVGAHVKSNSFVIAKAGCAVGVGAGQMSRVETVQIAIERSEGRAKGAVAASEAFFPFPDALRAAAAAGITAVVQPGGSVRDDESIAVADEAGMAMVFSGVRHFRH